MSAIATVTSPTIISGIEKLRNSLKMPLKVTNIRTSGAGKDVYKRQIVGDLRYLQLLSRSFPTIADASTEIINLEAILNLPKGTEHFLTDIHGCLLYTSRCV